MSPRSRHNTEWLRRLDGRRKSPEPTFRRGVLHPPPMIARAAPFRGMGRLIGRRRSETIGGSTTFPDLLDSVVAEEGWSPCDRSRPVPKGRCRATRASIGLAPSVLGPWTIWARPVILLDALAEICASCSMIGHRWRLLTRRQQRLWATQSTCEGAARTGIRQ
jgi:hypothetical protein